MVKSTRIVFQKETIDRDRNKRVRTITEGNLVRIIKGVLGNKELVQAIKDYERDRPKDLVAAPGPPPFTVQVERICEFLGPARWALFRPKIVREIQKVVLKRT